MKVLKKLQEARTRMLTVNMKKSGKNKFAGYEYFELGDFMPHITPIFNELGLAGVVNFTGEFATLSIYDTDDAGECIVFTSPLVFAENQKGQQIQSLGSTHTYFRRYLYLLALDLVEPDTVDAAAPPATPGKIPVKIDAEKAKAAPAPSVAAGDDAANVELFVDSMIQWGTACTTVEELTNLWKANQKEVTRIKEAHPSKFAVLQQGFADIRSALTSE